MGEGADDALDRAFDEEEIFHRVKHDSHALFEEGMMNEVGEIFHPTGLPVRSKIVKPAGPGPCPICGGPTTIRINKKLEIPFYGCIKYPSCRGNRDYA